MSFSSLFEKEIVGRVIISFLDGESRLNLYEAFQIYDKHKECQAVLCSDNLITKLFTESSCYFHCPVCQLLKIVELLSGPTDGRVIDGQLSVQNLQVTLNYIIKLFCNLMIYSLSRINLDSLWSDYAQTDFLGGLFQELL